MTGAISVTGPEDEPAGRPYPTFAEAFRTWVRIALLSFGGPAGQIAVMHRILVEEKRWLGERRFLHALNFCMLLPGPEAQQLAVYIGWLLHRTFGGVVAGVLFVLPGLLAIMGLSWVYAIYGNVGVVEALFFGLKAAVLAIVLQAVMRIGDRALGNTLMMAVAAASFVAIFGFDLPFPLIIATAALLGFFGSRLGFTAFDAGNSHGAVGRKHVADADTVLGEAVPAYVAQEAVGTYGWLAPGEMLDGLGMAETTPGPLIMVTQFVGFMGAFRDPGALPPLLAGALGGLLTTWVTFTPCFLWIFLAAAHVERLRENRALSAALATITAAVVGVVLNLAVWFALHVLFKEVRTFTGFGLHMDMPVLPSLDPAAALLTAAALFAVFRLKVGMMTVLGASAAAGALLHRIGWLLS